jgi:cAMP-dependent protein kinase regulator
MGCGGSREDNDYGAVAQAMIDIEKGKPEPEQVVQQQQQQQQQEYNIEPAAGFRAMSLASPKEVATEQQNLRNLAKQPSAAALTPEQQRSTETTSGARHLRNIFVPPLQPEEVASFQPPKFRKAQEEANFIQTALKKNFVFTNLSEQQMKTILYAFERVEFSWGKEIIKQGEEGDYFYVIRQGNIHYEVDGVVMGSAGAGQSFGELALVYASPRAASVISDSDCVLYRVDQITFRYIMQTQRELTEKNKRELLEGIPFLKDLDSTDLDRLADAMIPRIFATGEHLARKGDQTDTFFVIQEGKVRVMNVDVGMTKYEDYELGPGEHFGERALVNDEPRPSDFVGKTKGLAFAIDKQRFHETIGNFSQLIHKSQDKKRLVSFLDFSLFVVVETDSNSFPCLSHSLFFQSAIRLIQNTYLTGATLATLAAQIVDRKCPPRTVIFAEDLYTPAALYLVREGRVELKREDGRYYQIVEEGGYFGEDTLTADMSGLKQSSEVLSKYTVATLGHCTTLGILTLEECRKVIDTTTIGRRQRTDYTSIVNIDIPLKSLKKHAILGAGTFGQVWLTSKVAPDGTNRPYALKIQSKCELLRNQQAKGVIQEKDIMAQLNSPFIIKLVQTYQDDKFVYMLLGFVQGGELHSLVHPKGHDGISEKDTQFYASCILEGLSYMHRRQIVYRDVKPENILIAYGGYPVIVDLGFGKLVHAGNQRRKILSCHSSALLFSQTRGDQNVYALRNTPIPSP